MPEGGGAPGISHRSAAACPVALGVARSACGTAICSALHVPWTTCVCSIDCGPPARIPGLALRCSRVSSGPELHRPRGAHVSSLPRDCGFYRALHARVAGLGSDWAAAGAIPYRTHPQCGRARPLSAPVIPLPTGGRGGKWPLVPDTPQTKFFWGKMKF